MKYLISLVLIVSFIGCFSGDYLTKEVAHTNMMKVPLSKAEIRIRTLSFIAEHFFSEKNVIGFNEDGLISGNFITLIPARNDEWSQRSISALYGITVLFQDSVYATRILLKDILDLPASRWGVYRNRLENEISRIENELDTYIISEYPLLNSKMK